VVPRQGKAQEKRGSAVLKLDFGVHLYGFATSKDITPRSDPENSDVVEVEPLYDWRAKLRLSAVRVEPSVVLQVNEYSDVEAAPTSSELKHLKALRTSATGSALRRAAKSWSTEMKGWLRVCALYA